MLRPLPRMKLTQCQNQNPLNPLDTLIVLINFGIGIKNLLSNLRQEKRQTQYEKRQDKILCILQEIQGASQHGDSD